MKGEKIIISFKEIFNTRRQHLKMSTRLFQFDIIALSTRDPLRRYFYGLSALDPVGFDFRRSEFSVVLELFQPHMFTL